VKKGPSPKINDVVRNVSTGDRGCSLFGLAFSSFGPAFSPLQNWIGMDIARNIVLLKRKINKVVFVENTFWDALGKKRKLINANFGGISYDSAVVQLPK